MSGADGNRDIPGRFPLKASDPQEMSLIPLSIASMTTKQIQIHKRMVVMPILKKYQGKWIDAIGSIDIEYDWDLQYATLYNADACDLDILVRVM